MIFWESERPITGNTHICKIHWNRQRDNKNHLLSQCLPKNQPKSYRTQSEIRLLSSTSILFCFCLVMNCKWPVWYEPELNFICAVKKCQQNRKHFNRTHTLSINIAKIYYRPVTASGNGSSMDTTRYLFTYNANECDLYLFHTVFKLKHKNLHTFLILWSPLFSNQSTKLVDVAWLASVAIVCCKLHFNVLLTRMLLFIRVLCIIAISICVVHSSISVYLYIAHLLSFSSHSSFFFRWLTVQAMVVTMMMLLRVHSFVIAVSERTNIFFYLVGWSRRCCGWCTTLVQEFRVVGDRAYHLTLVLLFCNCYC